MSRPLSDAMGRVSHLDPEDRRSGRRCQIWRDRVAVGQHGVMAVLVDEAVWPWRGDRWAHLVSDESVAELHAFADQLGLRRMSFQGDHYDISESVRGRALALGAEPVRGRDLVRRLRGAGLRLAAPERPGAWEEVGRWDRRRFSP